MFSDASVRLRRVDAVHNAAWLLCATRLPPHSLPACRTAYSPPTAANYASPAGTGFLEQYVGWTQNITVNATAQPYTFYVTFDIASHGAFSPFPRVYKKLVYMPDRQGGATATIYTVPTYTVIIKLDQGKVTDIGWDDGCFFCAENTDECMHTGLDTNYTAEIPSVDFRGCRKSHTECYPDTMPVANSTDANVTLAQTGCDLKVFVTWTGTDKNGQFLRSASKRFSRYRQFGIATLYQSAINLANEGMNIANTAISAVQSVPGRILPSMGGGDGRRLSVEEVLADLEGSTAVGPPGLDSAAAAADEQVQDAGADSQVHLRGLHAPSGAEADSSLS